MPNLEVTDADDNKQQVILCPEHFLQAATAVLLHNPMEEKIQTATNYEDKVVEGLQKLKAFGPWKLLNGLQEWQEADGLIYHKGLIYVPPDTNLRRDIVAQHHDTITAGHPGQHSTLELVT